MAWPSGARRARPVIERKGSRGAAEARRRREEEKKRRRAKGLGRGKATIGPFRKTPKFPSQSPRLRGSAWSYSRGPLCLALSRCEPFPFSHPLPSLRFANGEHARWFKGRDRAEPRRRRGDGPRAWEGARPLLDLSAKHRSSPHNLRAFATPRGPTRAARCAWRCRVLGLSPSSIPCPHFVSHSAARKGAAHRVGGSVRGTGRFPSGPCFTHPTAARSRPGGCAGLWPGGSR